MGSSCWARQAPEGMRQLVDEFRLEPVEIAVMTGISRQPRDVKNWDYFNGAMLFLLLEQRDGETSHLGSGSLIAPGLGLTATHVIKSELEGLKQGDFRMLAIGIRERMSDMYEVRSFSYSESKGDLCWLSLSPLSEAQVDLTYRRFEMSTRAPRIGDPVTVLGYRFPTVGRSGSEILSRTSEALKGDLFACEGKVLSVFAKRDKVMVNYPGFEVDCGSLGGMSGGPALNAEGHVIGVVSSGLAADDGFGPTVIARIPWGLSLKPELVWPSGLYPLSPTSIVDLDDRLVVIHGRDALSRSDEGNLQVREW